MLFKSSGKNYQIDINTNRFDRQFLEAHKKLNILIVNDCEPYTPHKQGQLRSQIRYPEGIYGDTIEWYAPYAHYQYYGTVYTDELGRTYVRNGEVKKVNTGRPLTYHEPGTGDHWFERAKETHKAEWVRTVKRIGGGGV